MLSLTYNIFFCLDLFVTLKYPLISGRKRNIYYNLGAILLTVILYLMVHFDFTPSDACENYGEVIVYDYLFKPTLFSAITEIIFVLISFSFGVFGWCKV